jgi:hypothetical protein
VTSLLAGYLDRTGAPVIPATLRYAGPFHGGVALVKPFGSWTYGFIGIDGKWILEPPVAAYNEWSEGIAGFNIGGALDDVGDVVGGAWGLIGEGRVIKRAQYEDVGGCAQGLIPFRDGGLWGYLDREGNERVDARFDEADDFSKDGLAVVTEDGRDGYLDTHGEWKLQLKFDSLAPTSEGRGRAKLGDVWHVIDLEGNLLSEGFDEIRRFYGGMARVVRQGRVGYVDRDGQLIGKAWFDEGARYGDGLAPVRIDRAWYVLDRRGAVHGPYRRALAPTEGLARIVIEDGAVGFLGVDGQIAISPRYQTARAFHQGVAAAARDGLWTYIDTKGQELHEPYWHRAGSFHEGLATVRYGARAGVVDKTGRLVVPVQHDAIDDYSGGLAAVRTIQWRQVTAPPPDWKVTPPGGLAEETFTGAGRDDEVAISVAHGALPPDVAVRLRHVIGMWSDIAAAQAGSDAVTEDRADGDALALRLGGVPYPVELSAVLLEELRLLGVPIRELVLARIRSVGASGADWSTLPG